MEKRMIPGNRQQYASSPNRQHGMVVIVMCLLLLVAVSLILLSSGKTSIMEQLISANEYHAMEASQAAEAGLEYGLSWYRENVPVWATAAIPIACQGVFDQTAAPDPAPAVNAISGDQYQLEIHYCRNSNDRSVFQIASTATSMTDASISNTVRIYSEPVSDILATNFSGAPLIVDGCLSGITGTPQVEPLNPGDVVYETSQDLATALLGSCVRSGATLANGKNEGLTMNGGSVKHQAFAAGDIWNHTFRISRAEFQALSDAEVSAGVALADRNYIYYDNYASPTFNDNLGSPTHPVALVFSGTNNDCPKINGLVRIYGVVFIDAPCPNASGWGNTEIWGSVVIRGDADHLTANSIFHDWRQISVTQRPRFPNEGSSRLIGTWNDF